MDAKKYGPATALADSLITELAAAKTLTAENGARAAQDAVASIDTQIAAFNALLTAENVKLLATDAAKYQDASTQFGEKAAALQAGLDSGTALVTFNNAKTLAGEIAAATQELTAAIEKAKTAKPARAVRRR
jgi:hypothetical protein